ncbi:hypothetical protein QBC40DRAFT_186487 [Triangularia verruculosa]|uniref:Uncharacterized protein n=1 Tax=Triangularia verruculosa TaxID=2587418 RepID=A0AAN6X8Y1_9PEZI|nr:hypothetical protein QBC40DRAFT_186487 [Triangularia verruculosa]
MAQGAIKKAAKPNPGLTKAKGSGGGAKKVNKPQKAKSKTSADKQRKRYTAGMTAKTELMLGARAGHLELIGKGRDKTKKGGVAGEVKGGSRKFG